MKHILILEDGTELSSGADAQCAITSISLTESVNDSEVLSIGSAVASVLKVSAITPGGAFSVEAGREATLLHENEEGERRQVGIFILEKPERNTANSFTVTAYDRIVLLDQDVTQYLNSLDNWPYSLRSLAEGVCAYCGVQISVEDLPNGEYLVEKFSGEGVTGRQLIQWIGQAACRFCRANAQGVLEFGWYEKADDYVIGTTPEPFRDAIRVEGDSLILELPDDTSAVDGGTVTLDSRIHALLSEDGTATLTVDDGIRHAYYLSGGLSYEDYSTEPIDCVQIRSTAHDVGTVYPETGGNNAYVIEANPLLSAKNVAALRLAAETVYNILKDVAYTPCKVKIVGDYGARAGDIVKITDRNGKILTAYLMTVETGKGVQSLECVGPRRLSEQAVQNRYSVRALSGKILELRMDVDGITASVSKQEGEAYGRMTTIEQNAEGVRIKVQEIMDNGTDKVKTKMGYTFDDKGLRIQKDGEQMENLLDNKGMYVYRSGETVLRADASGVLATEVTVGTYLCIGDNSRLEDYGSGTKNRTACFFVG